MVKHTPNSIPEPAPRASAAKYSAARAAARAAPTGEQLSDAEWKVMHALWKNRVATARELYEILHPATGWAYTTVKTFCDRLVTKKAVHAIRDGQQILYEAAMPEEQARTGALRALIEKAFQGATAPLLQFLVKEGNLTKEERAQLEAVLEKARKRAGDKAVKFDESR